MLLIVSNLENIAVGNIFARESMLHYANNMKYGMIGPAS